MIKFSSFVLILMIGVFLILPFFASALADHIVPCGDVCVAYDVDTKACTKSVEKPCTICDLFVGTRNIINFLVLQIATPLAVAVLLYGGIMLLISGGSEEKLKKGKKAISAAIWGLVIVFAAWLIIGTIMGNLIKPGFIPVWNEFPGC